MFGLRKKVQEVKEQPVKKKSGTRKYKQLAVTAEAHAKVSKMALKKKTTIIDLVDELVGV